MDLVMLNKQRKFVLFIFILVILFITYWLGFTSNHTRIMLQPATTTIQALHSDRIQDRHMVQMQEEQQTSWTKPSIATSIPSSNVAQDNQHVRRLRTK